MAAAEVLPPCLENEQLGPQAIDKVPSALAPSSGMSKSFIRFFSTRSSFSEDSHDEGKVQDGDEPPPPLARRLSSSLSQSFKNMRHSISQRLGLVGQESTIFREDEIPANFLKVCKGNVRQASKRYAATVRWRREHDVDRLLQKPNSTFERMKVVYPQTFHGRSTDGDYVSFEKPGDFDVKKFRESKLKPLDGALHMAFMQEYMWSTVAPGDHGCIMNVLDVKGLSLGKLSHPEVIMFLKIISDACYAHYPERVRRILVVNAPMFFAPIFKVLSAVLPAVMREQIVILKNMGELAKYIDPNELPKEYGGTSPIPFGQYKVEKEMREFVDRLNNGQK